MKPLILLIACLAAAGAAAQTPPTAPSADSILKKIDENQVSGSRITVYEMTIRGRRGSRTMKAKSWVQGVDRAFTEYLEPPREAGTKMLKLGDQLWTFSPSTDRTIQIAGHMLRQSVMGSDMSYEDMMEDPKLQNLYTATVVGEGTLLERPCWILELTAKPGAEPCVPLAQGMGGQGAVSPAQGGTLRDERQAAEDHRDHEACGRYQQRWVAERAVFKDALKNDGGTEFVVTSIEFDAKIPEHVFSQAALRK